MQPAANSQLIIQVIGYKNTGKTTLVCRLTERFKREGYKVGTIKRDAHDFQIDKPGTDTWKHQAAGADLTAITSASRTAIMKAYPESLEQLIAQMTEADVILIEGFKNAPYPKIIMLRSEADFVLLAPASNPIAAAIWPELCAAHIKDCSTPMIAIDDTDQLFQMILKSSTHQ
ncbi:molybdopterin-guanine dinucleotide biosynthesis protein B [Paenibacillus sp. FSL H8-0548]|uniref:molybdopterin-guanine dinucleotide biosynthesis protein B n=1 Tax=Paenibacillus sp. FSL H8-0548 TaxID=1920422 RepID=UPI00096F0B65|nr:molybdopterin-guanine dinucleotide biosynthesis protein B [Paenibacillus sp. FSL H8-0548]OMF38882.1 molybdopterin-guanine dinucleotide biosynthesis protein B [Paenibacillus sp. FSL H8-0548]